MGVTLHIGINGSEYFALPLNEETMLPYGSPIFLSQADDSEFFTFESDDNTSYAVYLMAGEEPSEDDVLDAIVSKKYDEGLLDLIAARLFVDPNERLLLTNGEVTSTNGALIRLPEIPNRVSTNGAPVYSLREVVYNRESAAQGLLEPATIIGIRLTPNGWMYSITSGAVSKEMLHGDRRRISNQSVVELPENAFVDKLQAHVLINNALSKEIEANSSYLQ